VTMVAFPGLINDMKVMRTHAMQSAGQTPEQIAAAIALQTPLIQALMGFLGTVITGFIASLIIAIFVRKKG
jgi:hypothetical protein